MDIFIGDERACDERGAQEFAKQISSKPASVLGLATGSTPEGIYERLVDKYKAGQVSFASVKTFNLDEYLGIPINHVSSYSYYMYDKLFNHVDIQKNNINLLCPCPNSIDKECMDFEAAIKACGGIDLQILGLGPNGHIGFNEPGTPFESTTHLVELTESTIEANSRFFESPDQMPRQAITMGIKTIMQAQRIILMAKGQKKAHIIKEALTGPVTTRVPASVLQLHPNVLVILDRQAAAML